MPKEYDEKADDEKLKEPTRRCKKNGPNRVNNTLIVGAAVGSVDAST